MMQHIYSPYYQIAPMIFSLSILKKDSKYVAQTSHAVLPGIAKQTVSKYRGQLFE
jgi:hypothetical protein